jgi:hypothetical protein
MMNKVYPYMLNVRLTDSQRDRLKVIADTEELSVSDVVRDLIEARLAEAK